MSSEHARDRSDDYKRNLHVGAFHVDPGALVVQSDANAIRLKPKAMAVLLELARHPGITLSREELLDRVWKSSHVTPGVLTHAVTALRRAFGDSLEQPAYIETIPRIGYRLIAPVRSSGSDAIVEEVVEPIPVTTAPPDEPVQDDALPQIDALHESGLSALRDRGAGAGWRRVLTAATAVVGLVILLMLWRFARPEPIAPVLAVSDIRRLTFAPGIEMNPRLNNSGDWLVYSSTARLGAKPRLFMQSSYGTQARPLAAADPAERPVWSPEGRRVAYVWQEGQQCEIRIVSIDDDSRQTALRCPSNSVVYLDWNPANPNMIAFTTAEPGQMGGASVQLLSEDGGWRAKALVYDRPDANLDLFPRFSPDGRMIAFRRGSNPTTDIYVMPVTGGRVTRLTEVRARINGFDWLPDGSGLVFDSDHAGQQELYSILLSDRFVRSMGLADAASPDIAARDWQLTYQMESWQSSLVEVPLHGDAEPRALAPSSGRDRVATLSPDGARVVFVSDRDGSTQLWSLDRASGRTERLTQHQHARVDMPVISPDGQRVLYVVRSHGRHELWEYGFEDESRRRLHANPASLRNAIYASDGRSIWYTTAWRGAGWALHACERESVTGACTTRKTSRPAWRVERTRINGLDVLLLASPQSRREVEVVAEDGLRVLKTLQLPASDAWSVVDDSIWYLRGTGTNDSDTPTLEAMSLVDGSTRSIAALPGLRPLGYTPFLITRDQQRMILPTMTANSTDIAFARLAKPQVRR